MGLILPGRTEAKDKSSGSAGAYLWAERWFVAEGLLVL